MPHHLSRHLSNAAIFALSAAIAVVAERVAEPPRGLIAGSAARGSAVGNDISGFVAPPVFDSMIPPFRMPLRRDPFATGASREESAVASSLDSRTVRTSSASGGHVLSAILVANDRRVAVVDDEAVGVGDVLSDGARVSAIQPDRVLVVDSRGRWQTLTLTNRGQ
jgi:hypothetical protein